jgi:hypothetical protein
LDGYSRNRFKNKAGQGIGLDIFKKGKSYISLTIPNMKFGCVLSYVSRQPMVSFLKCFQNETDENLQCTIYDDGKLDCPYSAYTPERWTDNSPVKYEEFFNVLRGRNDFKTREDFESAMLTYREKFDVDCFRSLMRVYSVSLKISDTCLKFKTMVIDMRRLSSFEVDHITQQTIPGKID